MQPDPVKNHYLPVDFNRQYHALAGLDTREFLSWVYSPHKPFGDVGVVTSFGTESGVMLHLIAEVAPEAPVIFIDTGFHFEETLAYRDELAIGSSPEKENEVGMRMAGDALASFVDQEAQKELIEAQKSAAKKASRGGLFGGLLSAAGTIGGALIMSGCDERFKEDIAPLQTSEVNNDLSKMAFAVQEIRGHS